MLKMVCPLSNFSSLTLVVRYQSLYLPLNSYIVFVNEGQELSYHQLNAYNSLTLIFSFPSFPSIPSDVSSFLTDCLPPLCRFPIGKCESLLLPMNVYQKQTKYTIDCIMCMIANYFVSHSVFMKTNGPQPTTHSIFNREIMHIDYNAYKTHFIAFGLIIIQASLKEAKKQPFYVQKNSF